GRARGCIRGARTASGSAALTFSELHRRYHAARRGKQAQQQTDAAFAVSCDGARSIIEERLGELTEVKAMGSPPVGN
ncbi:MAG TPA: hypothetical protein VIV60_00165, partial [Polyangiaceae bacterium]